MGVRRDLDVVNDFPCVDRGENVFRSRLDPANRTIEQPREEADQELLTVHVHLCPEAATDVGNDDAQIGLRDAERLRQHGPDDERQLRRRPQGEALEGRSGHAPTRLERHRRVSWDPVAVVEDMGSDRQGGFGALAREPHAGEDVVPPLRVDQRIAHRRLFERSDRFEWRVVHADQLGGVLRDAQLRRDDGRDRLPDRANDIGGEGLHRRRANARRPFVPDLGAGRKVSGDEDVDDAPQARGRRPIDARDPGVGDWGSNEHDVERIAGVEVRHEARPAAHQRLVLETCEGTSDPPALGHGVIVDRRTGTSAYAGAPRVWHRAPSCERCPPRGAWPPPRRAG